MILQCRQVSTEWFFQSCLESLGWLQLAGLNGLIHISATSAENAGMAGSIFLYVISCPQKVSLNFFTRWWQCFKRVKTETTRPLASEICQYCHFCHILLSNWIIGTGLFQGIGKQAPSLAKKIYGHIFSTFHIIDTSSCLTLMTILRQVLWSLFFFSTWENWSPEIFSNLSKAPLFVDSMTGWAPRPISCVFQVPHWAEAHFPDCSWWNSRASLRLASRLIGTRRQGKWRYISLYDVAG